MSWRELGEEQIRLQRLEADGNVPGLIQSLDKLDKKDTRLSALWALGRLGDAQAVPHVIERIDDSDRLVRSAAIQTLGVLQTEEAEEPLLGALHNEDDWVRGSAASALGRVGGAVGGAEALERRRVALRDALDNDTELEVRISAAESLLVLGDREVASQALALIKQLSWRRRSHPQIKRLKAAAKLGESLTPYPFLWERGGPPRTQP